MSNSEETSGYIVTCVVYFSLTIILIYYILKVTGIIEWLRLKIGTQIILDFVPNERKIPEVISTKIRLFKSLSDFNPAPKILEVGAGNSNNVEFYPKDSRYIVVEPNENFHPHLKQRIAEAGSHLRLEAVYADTAEKLAHVEDESVDAYVMTHVTCEVIDMDAVFSEARRVLKPGGRLYIYHHFLGPNANLRSLQALLERYVQFGLFITPITNCQVNRDIEADVRRYFPDTDCKVLDIPYPGITIRYHQVIESKKS